MRLALVIALLGACGSDPAPAPGPAPAAPRRADAGTAPADAPIRKFVGVLSAAESVDITPRIAGVIAKVDVGPGDTVSVDQVVVEMDPVQVREELRAAQAALAAASAGSRQAAIDVEDARRKLELETTSVKVGVSATSAVDEAKIGVRRAEAALERARSNAAAESARAQTARDHLTSTSLRAPFAGTVANRFRDAGNRVESGVAILRIVGHGKMRLRFAVPPNLLSLVPVGAAVTASVDTVARPVSATVKQVSPSIDAASGLVLVEAELEGQGETALRAGLAVWVDAPKP